MPGDPADAIDPRFPNLAPEVVAGYLDAPEHMVVEVIDGELSVMPRPRPRHARAATKLGAALDGPYDTGRDGPGGWVFLFEPELHLGPKPDIVVPDVAGWRRERFPDGALDDDAPGAISVAPDWLCEVLSPRTAKFDRGKKRRVYRREGVEHLWFVDPSVEIIEVFQLRSGWYVLVDTFEGDALLRAEPFEAMDLELSTLWRLQTNA